jgi:cytosine/creatinine deaminase
LRRASGLDAHGGLASLATSGFIAVMLALATPLPFFPFSLEDGTANALKGAIMNAFITRDTPVTDEVLNTIAYLPTSSLSKIVEDGFFKKLTDKDFMRIAVLLAIKGYGESGSPIGGVVIDNETRKILGKGHNTLIQENHPYNHGETSAVRDAGRQDFSKTTIFTTLSPCDICATLIYMREFNRVVVGDVTNASGNEELLRQKGVQVDILEDPEMIAFYAKYRKEKPDQDLEDWKGLAAVRRAAAAKTEQR